jgi:hypothetical protein
MKPEPSTRILSLVTNGASVIRMQTGRRVIAAVALAATICSSSTASAQESLRDQVQNHGADWMVGEWKGTNAQGRAVEVEYEWELEGHALEVDLTIGDDHYKGLIFRRPAEGDVVEVGADSRGGTTRSTWELKEGALVTKRTGTRPDGQVVRVAVVNKQVDADTFVATLHPLSTEGEVGEETLETVRLSRGPQSSDQD